MEKAVAVKSAVMEKRSGAPVKSAGAARILAAAEALFSKHGYEAAALSRIAKKARQSQANIIYHFKSKRGLYLACLRNARERLISHFALEDIKGGGMDEFIRGFARIHLAALMNDEKAARLLYREILGYGSMEGKELAEKILGHDLQCFTGILKEGGDGGSFRKGINPAVVAFLLIGMNALFIHAGGVVRHLPGGEFTTSAERFHKEALGMLLYGAIATEKSTDKT